MLEFLYLRLAGRERHHFIVDLQFCEHHISGFHAFFQKRRCKADVFAAASRQDVSVVGTVDCLLAEGDIAQSVAIHKLSEMENVIAFFVFGYSYIEESFACGNPYLTLLIARDGKNIVQFFVPAEGLEQPEVGIIYSYVFVGAYPSQFSVVCI